MKERIKIDSSILSLVVILTGFMFFFPGLYSKNTLLNDLTNFFGIIFILKGNFIRMAARGHKKAHSAKSESLVTTGLYSITRNPMYLGSFTMGAGFVLIVWPWWALPIFGFLFYLRFRIQVKREEEHLFKNFPEDFKAYCNKVPCVFPSLKKWPTIKAKDVLSLDEAFSTKETRGLFLWPLLAFGLEYLQQMFVFQQFSLIPIVYIFVIAILAFDLGFLLSYLRD